MSLSDDVHALIFGQLKNTKKFNPFLQFISLLFFISFSLLFVSFFVHFLYICHFFFTTSRSIIKRHIVSIYTHLSNTTRNNILTITFSFLSFISFSIYCKQYKMSEQLPIKFQEHAQVSIIQCRWEANVCLVRNKA